MDPGWLIFLGTFVVALLWNIATGGGRSRAVKKGARTVARQLVALYGGAHDIRETQLARFPRLDASFYERGRRELESILTPTGLPQDRAAVARTIERPAGALSQLGREDLARALRENPPPLDRP